MLALKQGMTAFSLPPEADVSIDWRVMGFGLAVAFLTSVVCGLVPALLATRPSLLHSIRPGSGSGRSRGSLRSLLVVGEMALAFVLLTGAGLLLRTFANLQKVD